MADPTLSTGISRRTILAGGSAAMLSAAPVPTVAAAGGPAGDDPDALLLRRVARARRLGVAYLRAQAVRRRLFRIACRNPDRPGLPPCHPDNRAFAGRVGYWPADARCWRLFDRYAQAARAAIATPARTARGVHAKLALAAKASRRGDLRVYPYEDRSWQRRLLADLARLNAD